MAPRPLPKTHKWVKRIEELRSSGFTHSLVVKKSRISGAGLFTREHIFKDEIIIEYTGERISKEEAERREQSYKNSTANSSHVNTYLAELDGNTVVDATNDGNVSKYINHSCQPNCISEALNVEGYGMLLVISALRNIRGGAELTMDYGFNAAKSPEASIVKFPISGHVSDFKLGYDTDYKYVRIRRPRRLESW